MASLIAIKQVALVWQTADMGGKYTWCNNDNQPSPDIAIYITALDFRITMQPLDIIRGWSLMEEIKKK